MPLARQLSNPGSNGSNVRWDVRGLQSLGNGWFTDGVYAYREDGLSDGYGGFPGRPDIVTPGLPAANENYAEWWARNPNGLGDQRSDTNQQPPAAVDPEQPAAVNQEQPAARVLDRDNPRAVEYALRRLAQLRGLGFEFEEMDDPTATWREASKGVSAAAGAEGFVNPRDWLEGRNRTSVPARTQVFESVAEIDPVAAMPPRPQMVRSQAPSVVLRRGNVKGKIKKNKSNRRPAVRRGVRRGVI